MKEWQIQIFKRTDMPNAADYIINSGEKQQFVFQEGLAHFQEACRSYPYPSGQHGFYSNVNSTMLAKIFEAATPKSHILIESDEFQFIPFEALKVDGIPLAQRNFVSRRGKGDKTFSKGALVTKSDILVIKCFSLKRNERFSDLLCNTFSRFKGINPIIKTAATLDELIGFLKDSRFMVIHLIAHIEDDMIIGGEKPISLNDLKKRLESATIYANLIVLSCCGKLSFEDPDDENLFSPFFSQVNIKAVVGMSRIIYADNDLSYLDAFYSTLFMGKTVSEAVNAAVCWNMKKASMPKEEDPLPLVHFGAPSCRFEKKFKKSGIQLASQFLTNKKLGLSLKFRAAVFSIFAALIAVFLIISLQPKPKFENLAIDETLVVSGTVKGLPSPSNQKRHVIVAAATKTEMLILPEDRFSEIEADGRFAIKLFTSDEELSQSSTCYLTVIEIGPVEEAYLLSADNNEFIDFVNKNKVIGTLREISHND